jgi:CHAT domain-containing protein/tetratricopeptide (TPR) repeat protein
MLQKEIFRRNRFNREQEDVIEHEKHLSNEQIEWFLEPRDVTQRTDSRDQLFDQLSRHVATCAKCQRLVSMHAEWNRNLNGLRDTRVADRTRECPADGALFNLAAGIASEGESEDLLTHASQCNHCGPLLRDSMNLFREESTSEERLFIETLQSAKPEWQSRMTAILRDTGQSVAVSRTQSFWAGFFSWPRLTFTAAAFALVVVATFIGIRMLRSPSPDQLLARAYTERRTMEVRIPGAKYAPLRIERSNDKSNFDRPESLLKAEALISENLRKNPNDPTWLQAKARAELLDGNSDEALRSLERSLESNPDSASLLADLGSAYYLRGKSTNQPVDYGKAVEFLGRALAKTPDDPVTLFNHALACEQLYLYAQAVEDWEHYLRLDAQGGWADEARKRLANVRQKMQQREHSETEPLLEPSAIANARIADNALRAAIDARIEAYLHIALTEWLPGAFPASISNTTATDSKAALFILGSVLRDEHSDSWLTDLLSYTPDAKFTAAVNALSSSIAAEDRGDYFAAHSSAHVAAELFRQAHCLAGELRAQAEEIYSDQLLYEGPQCELLLNKVTIPLQHTSYTWLQAQISLETSNCADLVGDVGTYQTEIDNGIALALEHKYTTLYLRGLGFKAQAEASSGDARTGFMLASEGLAIFWSRSVDLMKGYNLYTDLDTAADEIHLPFLQTAIWKQATLLIDEHPDILQRAMAHRWYGNAAYMANMPALAIAEFSKASALLSQAPQTAATTRDYLDSEVWLALLETRQGDLDRANARLDRNEPILAAAPSFVPELRFANARAEIAMRRNDAPAAESALKTAIYLAEWALKSLSSEKDRAQWARETQSTYRDFVEWKLRQGDSIGALEVWEWYKGAELRADQETASDVPRQVNWDAVPDFREIPPLPAPTTVENQLALFHHETVVTYATFPDGIAAWTYDDRGIFSDWIPQSPEVRDLALRFHRFCSDPDSDIGELHSSGRALYDLLIGPLQHRLAKDRILLLEPDDFLTEIPWEALVDSESHYLVQSSPVVVIPGIYRLSSLRQLTPIGPDVRALIVSVASAPGLRVLTDADEEGRSVAARFRSAQWLHGEDANLVAIRHGIQNAVVFHFAGHALFSTGNSGLALEERDPATQRPRLLSAANLSPGLLNHLQLVVLSACDTAKEQQTATSGTEGLVQTFLKAGTRNVVAARWKVDSTQTAQFMERFYQNVLAGNSIPNSLRSSQLALASQSLSAHPYYWSAFELEGTQ